MKFEGLIAWKHLTRRRKTGFVSLISLISILGVAVGVMALIVVLAVMSGFDRELKQKIVNVQPHLRIEKMGGIDAVEQDIQKVLSLQLPMIQSIAPFVEGQAILKSDRNASGVIVKGLDPAREELSIYEKHITEGDLLLEDVQRTVRKRFLLFFKKNAEVTQGSILIGEGLAARLQVRVGDAVNLISPFKAQERRNQILTTQAESQTFVVRGIFRLGMSDFDAAMAIVSVRRAQQMYHLGEKVTGLSVRFVDVDDSEKWKNLVAGLFGHNYIVRSWYDMNENFFQALQVEKSVMTILLALIILVASFNIVATLIMVVMEKTKDIGILRALGATRASIRKIFVLEGFSIGSLGICLGAFLGLIMAFNLNPISDFLKNTTGFEVFPSDIYYFDKIPVVVNLQDVFLIISFALIAAILAGMYPAHRASGINLVDALRYE